MAIVRVTKQFRFEMAHALWNYDGPCKNIHGHSYVLYVTVTGTPIKSKKDSKNGMVVDFGDLKKIVETTIVKQFDHSLVLSADTKAEKLKNIPEMFDRCIFVKFQPTCENLVAWFAEKLFKEMPKGINLHSLRLDETATSYAEWHAIDNK